MKKLKKGDALYQYDPISDSISKFEISSNKYGDICFKGEKNIAYTQDYIKSRLKSEDINEAMRLDKKSLINLVYKVKFNEIEGEITSFEEAIFGLRKEIQTLIEWRKKEIGNIPKPKKTITINCSVPTFVIR